MEKENNDRSDQTDDGDLKADTQQQQQQGEGGGAEKITLKTYYNFIKSNKAYTLIWAGSIVSLTGDWLNRIACLTVLGRVSAPTYLVSIYLLTMELPYSICGPFSGVVADMFDRRKVMIAADLTRMVIVLGFLFVRSSSTTWLLITLSFLQVCVSTFFEPAASSLIPVYVPRHQLLVANTVQGVTWSTMLVLGAAAGGVVTFSLGTDVNYICDSLSYLASALLIMRLLKQPFPTYNNTDEVSETTSEPLLAVEKQSITIIGENTDVHIDSSTPSVLPSAVMQEERDNPTEENDSGSGEDDSIDIHKKDISSIKKAWLEWVLAMKGAYNYLEHNRYILFICTIKATGAFVWAGFDLVTIRLSLETFKIGSDGSATLSILYMSAGVGCVLGPYLCSTFIEDTPRGNIKSLVLGFVGLTLGVLLASIPHFALSCIGAAVRAAGGGVLWVFSDVVKQKNVPEKLLGRVSAFELILLPLGSVITRTVGAVLLDEFMWSPFLLAFAYGLVSAFFSVVCSIYLLCSPANAYVKLKNSVS